MPQALTSTRHRLAGVLDVVLHDHRGTAPGLRQVLPGACDDARSPVLALHVHARAAGVGGPTHRGNYKGVPWCAGLEVEAGSVRTVHFHAAAFATFLVSRLVLLPLFKSHLAAAGGVPLIGAAFAHAGRTVVVCGRPGSGKTRVALQAVAAGAGWIGDNELALFGDGRVGAVFDEVELRRSTVRDTPWWSRLGPGRRLRLRGHALVRVLTAGRVAFNLPLRPAALGLRAQLDEAARPRVAVLLSDAAGIEPLAMEALVEYVTDYERDYAERFGALCGDRLATLPRALAGNLPPALAGATLWRAPRGCSFGDLRARLEREP